MHCYYVFLFTKTYTKVGRVLLLVFSQIRLKINKVEAAVNIFTLIPAINIYTTFMMTINNCYV